VITGVFPVVAGGRLITGVLPVVVTGGRVTTGGRAGVVARVTIGVFAGGRAGVENLDGAFGAAGREAGGAGFTGPRNFGVFAINDLLILRSSAFQVSFVSQAGLKAFNKTSGRASP
jgi:hypothetical protein